MSILADSALLTILLTSVWVKDYVVSKESSRDFSEKDSLTVELNSTPLPPNLGTSFVSFLFFPPHNLPGTFSFLIRKESLIAEVLLTLLSWNIGFNYFWQET